MNKVVFFLSVCICAGHFALAALPETSCPAPGTPIGSELGRGGAAVVCLNQYNELASIELFDYWEQRTLSNLIAHSPNTTDPVLWAKEVLYFVRKFSPQRAQAYELFIDRFLDRVQWVDGDLEPAKNVCSKIAVPTGCKVDQLIARRSELEAPENKLYVVNKRLWNEMIAPYRGGAILHEAFYDEAIRAGHRDSHLARYFNVVMHSNDADAFTDRDYAQTVQKAGFPFWEFHQVFQRSLTQDRFEQFTEEQLQYDMNNMLTSIEAREHARLELFHPLLGRMADKPDPQNAHYSSFVKRVLFSRGSDGEIVRGVLEKRKDLGNPYVILNGQRVELAVPGEIAILRDSSLRLNLASCYRDPGTQHEHCGEVVVNLAGAVQAPR